MKKNYCIVDENPTDKFVGIRFHNGIPEVVFPHGFDVSEDEIECRKDIFRLLAVLKRFSHSKDGQNANESENLLYSLPLSAYQYIMLDFLSHGYYVENETRYVSGTKGKIHWKRTIQREKPHLNNNNIVYLSFQLKTNKINENNLMSKIHRYCVYQSFFKFGWLYFDSAYLPPKPLFKIDKTLFVATLQKAMSTTFNDEKRKLFQSMIDVIVDKSSGISEKDFSIGTDEFDLVWERLIDHVFGEVDKDKYFPHATWHILHNNQFMQSSPLEPDTIMKYDGKMYVLDAKYYKFGITGTLSHLPPSSSIQKQITYGKYIAENSSKFHQEKVYNAFLMPFNAHSAEKMKFIGVGTADWEKYTPSTKNYNYVLGILLDTKWLISEYTRHNSTEIGKLANLIEESISSYRQMTEHPTTTLLQNK